MTDDEIPVENHKEIVAVVDYFVSAGTVYETVVNDFSGDVSIREVEEIPDEYWQTWERDEW